MAEKYHGPVWLDNKGRFHKTENSAIRSDCWEYLITELMKFDYIYSSLASDILNFIDENGDVIINFINAGKGMMEDSLNG